MLLVGILGLIALVFGVKNILGSGPVQWRDGILTAVGFIAAAIGMYQAYRLRPRS